jgi:hypothetical protein
MVPSHQGGSTACSPYVNPNHMYRTAWLPPAHAWLLLMCTWQPVQQLNAVLCCLPACLPAAYVLTINRLIKSLRESLEAETSGAPEYEVRTQTHRLHLPAPMRSTQEWWHDAGRASGSTCFSPL